MKFTLGEIYGLTRNLQKLTEKELPIRVSYRLLTFLRDCSVEMETLEKARIKLVEKYAGEKEEGKEMKVLDENKDKFQEEFSSLLIEEIELDFEPIPLDDLENISLSTNDLIPMQKIIKEK